jgi:hypothetical protein
VHSFKVSSATEQDEQDYYTISGGKKSVKASTLDNFQRVKLILLLSNKIFTLQKIGC